MNRFEILLEDMSSRLDGVLDILDIVVDELKKKADQSTVDDILDELRTMKLVEKDHGQQLHDHESRIIKLESI